MMRFSYDVRKAIAVSSYYHAGTAKNEVMQGNNRAQYILGEGGNDTIYGGGGNDVIEGGSGKDYLAGERGTDSLKGETGNDHLVLGSTDIGYGGTGTDTFEFLPGTSDVVDYEKRDLLEFNDVLYKSSELWKIFIRESYSGIYIGIRHDGHLLTALLVGVHSDDKGHHLDF